MFQPDSLSWNRICHFLLSACSLTEKAGSRFKGSDGSITNVRAIERFYLQCFIKPPAPLRSLHVWDGPKTPKNNHYLRKVGLLDELFITLMQMGFVTPTNKEKKIVSTILCRFITNLNCKQTVGFSWRFFFTFTTQCRSWRVYFHCELK